MAWVSVSVAMCADAGGEGASPPYDDLPFFAETTAYDTVADVGQAGDPNRLLHFRYPIQPQLVGDGAVVFADQVGGRMVMVNLLTGDGWEVDDEGGAGPGEFSGMVPSFGESGGLIYTASQTGQGATWTLDGNLLDARRYAEFLGGDGTSGPVLPQGMMDDGVIIGQFEQILDVDAEGNRTFKRALRAYSPDLGVLWEYADLPEYVRPANEEDVPMFGGIVVHARDSTVAIVVNGEPSLLVLDFDGEPRARIDLPYDAFRVFVDADERVWVQTWAENRKGTGSWLVYDRDLSRRLMAVAERNIQDARGEMLLTLDTDSIGAVHLYLLRRVAP